MLSQGIIDEVRSIEQRRTLGLIGLGTATAVIIGSELAKGNCSVM